MLLTGISVSAKGQPDSVALCILVIIEVSIIFCEVFELSKD